MVCDTNVELYANDKLVFQHHNVSTTAGRELLMEALTDNTRPDIQIKFAALGTGTGSFVQSNTSLFNEVYRVGILEPAIYGATQRQYAFPLGRPAYRVTEIGLFMGADATSTLNTGVLFNHSPLVYRGTTEQPELTAVITIGIRDGV